MESGAPDRLESIRTLLNTWRIPNDTRDEVDDLRALLSKASVWKRAIPDIRYPSDDSARLEVVRLRASLRAALTDGASSLRPLLADLSWRLTINGDDGDEAVRWRTDPPSVSGDALSIVTQALTTGTWTRLRACPDCRWVFFDTSRNSQRTWCSMTATDGGRGCGSIAKTRAYRRRRRPADRTTTDR